MEQNGHNDQKERPKDDSKLPQLPPVLLQKIASMLRDDGEHLQLRVRIRFASVSRQMNVAVRGSIDGMQRRRVRLFDVQATSVRINDVVVSNQPTTGYTQTECIDALLAFGRPNEIRISLFGGVAHVNAYLIRNRLLILERLLASIPPNSVLQLYLEGKVRKFGAGTPFYRIMTSIGKMVNLEKLKILFYWDYDDLPSAAVHKNSSPSLPPGSPFLQLLKLEKLRAPHVAAYQFLTVAQQADLINRSSSNISHICIDRSHFSQLVASLNARSRSNITSLCCLRVHELPHSTADQLLLLVERLPQCTSVSAFVWIIPDRREIDQIGGRLLESAINVGHKKKMTVRLVVFSSSFASYQSAGGQTEFTYEHKSTIVQVMIVSEWRSCAHD